MQESVRPLAGAVAAAVTEAMSVALPTEPAGTDPLVRRSDHADFQSNVALSLAKQLGKPPREVATAIRDQVAADIIAASELSGPGFINITLNDPPIWEQLRTRTEPRLGVGRPLAGQRVVIDYSSPNIAKQMHVGHLRTTIIGDALARVLTFLGAQVIRQNHLGDWGTQFGMLIQYIDEHPEAKWHRRELGENADAPITALDALYRQAREKFDSDTDFAGRARARVVALQRGDEATFAVWQELVDESLRSFQALYDRLGVLLTPDDADGESFYNPELDDVAQELIDRGIAVESNGALVVFFEEFTGPDGNPTPMIVRKSDGGYGYAATDLATIRHRVRKLEADRILYVVGSPRITARVPAEFLDDIYGHTFAEFFHRRRHGGSGEGSGRSAGSAIGVRSRSVAVSRFRLRWAGSRVRCLPRTGRPRRFHWWLGRGRRQAGSRRGSRHWIAPQA